MFKLPKVWLSFLQNIERFSALSLTLCLFILGTQSAFSQSFTHTKKEIDVWYARVPNEKKVIAITQGPLDHKITEEAPIESGFYTFYLYDDCDDKFDCTSSQSVYSMFKYGAVYDVYFAKVLEDLPGEQLVLILADRFHGTRTSGYDAYIFDFSTPRSHGPRGTKITLVAEASSIDPKNKKDMFKNLTRIDASTAELLH